MEYLLGDLNVDPSDMEQSRVVGTSDVTATEMPEYLATIQEEISNTFLAGYLIYVSEVHPDIQTLQPHEKNEYKAKTLAYVNKLLKDNDAIIAGGFLLGTIYKYRNISGDIDIYVPCKNLKRFNKAIAKLSQAETIRTTTATSYCLSFLRKNGIRTVQTLKDVKRRGFAQLEVDIMAVRNSNSPLNVVKNFDLSFCQIWYDGEKVYATHPDHVREKKGILQNEYIPNYLNRNRFILNRIQKYIGRGFKVNLETPTTIDTVLPIGKLAKCEIIEKNDAFYKHWISRTLLHYLKTDVAGNNYTVQYKKHKRVFINKQDTWGYEHIERDELAQPIEEMKPLNIMDGYDSDEYDITVKEKYYPELNYLRHEDAVLDDEAYFWLALRNLVNKMYTPDRNNSIWPSLLYNSRAGERYNHQTIYNFIEGDLKDYFNSIKPYVIRVGMDAVTLDDEQVYDMHLHNLDQGISAEGLEGHLRGYMELQDKDLVPCYVPGCREHITLDIILPIVSKEFFMNFTKPPPLPPPTPLLGNQRLYQSTNANADRIVDLIEVLRDTPETSGGWQNVYHHVMCPFCLDYVSRDAGCMYVQHPNPEERPVNFAPYCRAQDLIGPIYDEYKDDNGVLRSLEVCAECGRPCSRHQHFSREHLDRGEAPELIPSVNPDTGDYIPGRRPDECAGGKRVEGIARIIAVNQFMRERPGSVEGSREFREEAAIYAERHWSDQRFVNKAREILEKPPAQRQVEDINLPIVEVPIIGPGRYPNYSNNEGNNNNGNVSPIPMANIDGQLGGKKYKTTRNKRAPKKKEGKRKVTRKH